MYVNSNVFNFDVLSRVSASRGACVHVVSPNSKEQTPRIHFLGHLFSFAAGSLDQSFFPVYIVYYSLVRLISIADKRTKARKKGREKECKREENKTAERKEES